MRGAFGIRALCTQSNGVSYSPPQGQDEQHLSLCMCVWRGGKSLWSLAQWDAGGVGVKQVCNNLCFHSNNLSIVTAYLPGVWQSSHACFFFSFSSSISLFHFLLSSSV